MSVSKIGSVLTRLAVFLSLFALAPAFSAEPTAKQVEEILEPIRKQHDVPALAAAIVRVGKPPVIAAVGVRKRGDDTAVTVDDKFHLGSCTKAVTATLIARLVEQGKLKWDDPLEKLFPEHAETITAELKPVTLAHLLAHQSALVDPEIGEFWKLGRKGAITEQRMAAVKQAVAQKPKHTPGEHFHYANINYVVAGAAAERVSGKSWEELIDAEIFEPLGMSSAGFGAMASEGKVDQPWSHQADGKPIEPGLYGDNPPVIGPAGRVHCSLKDWSKFIEEHLQGEKRATQLLQPASYKLLHAPEFSGSNYTRGGWGRFPTSFGEAIGHDGSNTLNYSTAFVLPSKGVAILVVSNQGPHEGNQGGQAACQDARKKLSELVLGTK
jgi:CubicO group peptidase (beta-lactamase class C family)